MFVMFEIWECQTERMRNIQTSDTFPVDPNENLVSALIKAYSIIAVHKYYVIVLLDF